MSAHVGHNRHVSIRQLLTCLNSFGSRKPPSNGAFAGPGRPGVVPSPRCNPGPVGMRCLHVRFAVGTAGLPPPSPLARLFRWLLMKDFCAVRSVSPSHPCLASTRGESVALPEKRPHGCSPRKSLYAVYSPCGPVRRPRFAPRTYPVRGIVLHDCE